MVDAQELSETLAALTSDEVQALDQELHAGAPTGTWADAPALASSTVAMENTSGYPVEVNITSGTVTVVKKNGVTLTGVTSGRVTLRPNATVAITYSVAPTLQWIYW
jgi:hypothetical protein